MMTLITEEGPLDLCFAPAGFPDGYNSLSNHASVIVVGAVDVLVASLRDVVIYLIWTYAPNWWLVAYIPVNVIVAVPLVLSARKRKDTETGIEDALDDFVGETTPVAEQKYGLLGGSHHD